MTKEMLQRIRDFAEENLYEKNEDKQIYVEAEDVALTNPWMDRSARFSLDDVGAVKEWGLEAVINFCEKVEKKLNGKTEENVYKKGKIIMPEKKKELIKKMTEMANVWADVLILYDEIAVENYAYGDEFAEGYPFNRSFDELLWEFLSWIDILQKG